MVADRAKSVADVGGRPFLELVLERLERAAPVRRVILCVGHRAQTVQSAFGRRHGRLALEYSPEGRPLGTGGALARALRRHSIASPALALNGDTWFPVRFDALLAFHRAQRPALTLAAAHVADAGRYGRLAIERDRVVAFGENGAPGAGWINGGIYVLGREAIDALTGHRAPSFSLERDILGPLSAAGRVAALRSRARFIDIGVPADYALARSVLG